MACGYNKVCADLMHEVLPLLPLAEDLHEVAVVGMKEFEPWLRGGW